MKRIVFLLFTLAAGSSADDALTNESIVKMISAGVTENIVLNMVQSQPGRYSLTSDDLILLKRQGITDKIVAAMIAKVSGTTSATIVATNSGPVGAGEADIPQAPEIGAYLKKAGSWEEILPEVVNWKTGGVIKSISTAGIVKGDINGHIPGAHSRTAVTLPLEIVIFTPEGVAITEYQLIRLHEQRDSREFRTVTGGVMHVSGGATRDIVPFESKKVANRTYRVLMPHLGAGEYGFLPPGAFASASSASIGKMYTFHLLE